MIDKLAKDSDKIEKCEKCSKNLSRIYSFSFKWGRGSRPDSDRRREQMVAASNRDDYAEMERLQVQYDSTSKFFFAERKVKKEKVSTRQVAYGYKCINKDCEKFERPVDIYKPVSEVDKEELCDQCSSPLQRTFGLAGFTIKNND